MQAAGGFGEGCVTQLEFPIDLGRSLRRPRAFAGPACTLAPHVLLENVRQPSHPRPGAFGIGEHEVDFAEHVVAVLERADVLVLGLPMYNFGLPSTLKA